MFTEIDRRLKSAQRLLCSIQEQRALKLCNCRGRGKRILITHYHTPEELEKILWVPCPVHGLRYPGTIWPRAPRLPLNPEDHDFCNCRPSAEREYLAGRRGPLTEEEREQEQALQEAEWDARVVRKSAADRRREFEEESARYRAVVDRFTEALRATGRSFD